jgi:hypothetical protein
MSRWVLLGLAVCALGAGPARAAAPGARDEVRARVVAAGREHLGKRFRGDCSGFVRRAHSAAGVPLPANLPGRSGSESLHRRLPHVRTPRPGDLAFFHRTYDRDGRRGPNLFTHVALVEKVEGPRVTLLHRGGKGVQRLRMNLARPSDPRENGAVRRRRAGDAPRQAYLTGQLFAGYASAFAPLPAAAVARASGAEPPAPAP